jgi:hypothetical protein
MEPPSHADAAGRTGRTRRLQRERREGVFVMGLEVERETVGRPVMEN